MPPLTKLSPEPAIDASATVTDSRLGVYTEVGPRTQIAHSELGDYSYIVNDGDIINSRIGKFCSLAAMVRINPGNHPMERASQHHFTYRSRQFGMGEDDPQVFARRRARTVVMGHDVWLGHGAVILPGVTIGSGAVVAAGGVVSKDVPPYTIVAGVPAKAIRERFGDEIQTALLRIAWWDWTHQTLSRRMHDFRCLSIEQFVAKYDREGPR